MTEQEWLKKILSNKEALHHWLQRQYIGEVTAANRIRALATKFPLSTKVQALLRRISNDEDKHSEWVKKLLVSRNIPLPSTDGGEARYWQPILSSITSFEDVAAAGHHAEAMRLVRIKALADSGDIDEDIRNIFKAILPDEEFHERAFKSLSSPISLKTMSTRHQDGLKLLGLEI